MESLAGAREQDGRGIVIPLYSTLAAAMIGVLLWLLDEGRYR